MHVIELRPRAPFLVTPHLRRFSIPNLPIPAIIENTRRSCRRSFNGNVWRLIVEREGDNPLLKLEVYRGDAGYIIGLISRMYMFNLNYRLIEERAKKFPELLSIIKRFCGLRPVLVPSMWEAISKTITMQNIQLKFALRIISNIVRE